jgi:anti-sigma factor RsiW
MNCRVAERRLSQSLDRALDRPVQDALEAHLAVCGRCRVAASEFRALRGSLAEPAVPEPLPYFWSRLEARLDTRPAAEPASLWLRWSLKAIPVSLAMIAGFLGAMLFFLPSQAELSQQEALLFSEENPIAETRTILDDDKPGNREIAILFAADDRLPVRKNRP